MAQTTAMPQHEKSEAPLPPTPPRTPKRAGGGGRVVLMCSPMTTTICASVEQQCGQRQGQHHDFKHQLHTPAPEEAGPPPRLPAPAVAVFVCGSDFGDSGKGALLQHGSRVRIEGLMSQPEWNGHEGSVKKLLPDDRVWVKLVRVCTVIWASCFPCKALFSTLMERGLP